MEGRRRTSKINEHKSYHIAQEAKRLRLEEALGAPMDKHALPVPHIGNMGDLISKSKLSEKQSIGNYARSHMHTLQGN